MDGATYQRAAVSAGLWFAVVYGVATVFGAPVAGGFSHTAIDAAIVAASSVGSDMLHEKLQWQSSGVTSAVATGGIYAAIQRAYRGDSNFLGNIALAGANEYAVERWWDYQQQQRYDAAMAEAADEGMMQ
jgi:hypothetical protein